jgi:probable F420-dependent oxidoreductase
MKIGVGVYVTDNGIDAVTAGRAAEDAGLDAIFVGDHTHIPAGRSEIHGQDDDPMFVDCYARFYDPLIALAAIAATTSTLAIGCGVVLIPEREPIALAKQLATLDHMSGGRLLVGIGAGWNLQETRNHGVDPAQRFAVMRERVEAMREIWSNDVAEYHGSHVDFPGLMSWPKPAQRPGPPIIMGGRGPRVFDRVFAYADAWGPDVLGGMEPLDALVPQIGEFGDRCEVEGRQLPMYAFGVMADEACIRRARDLGFTMSSISIPPGDAAETERAILEAGRIARAALA